MLHPCPDQEKIIKITKRIVKTIGELQAQHPKLNLTKSTLEVKNINSKQVDINKNTEQKNNRNDITPTSKHHDGQQSSVLEIRPE